MKFSILILTTLVILALVTSLKGKDDSNPAKRNAPKLSLNDYKCKKKYDKAQCEGLKARCFWSKKEDKCKRKCKSLKSEDNCVKRKHCKYQNDMCVPKPFNMHKLLNGMSEGKLGPMPDETTDDA